MANFKEYIRNHKRTLLIILISFLAGAFWLFAMRFVLIKNNEVHYHANFAVFIEGQRVPFDNPLYYEEVQSCGGPDFGNPKIRVHMHDMVNHVAHVHDNGATWGHFFANLGMTAGDVLFRYDDVIYIKDEQTDIRYMLNDQEVETIANRTIKSEDVLLVSIGKPTDDDMKNEYGQIEKDAGEYNKRNDPSACTGGKPLTFGERFKKALGFGE